MSDYKSKTYKVTRTPLGKTWLGGRQYSYKIESGSNSIWSSNMWIVLLQIIVGIVTFCYVYNGGFGKQEITQEEQRLIDEQFNPNNLPPAVRDWKPLNQR